MPRVIDDLENGAVKIRIVQHDEPLRNSYWVQSGVGAIEFRELEWAQLCELVEAYQEEERQLFEPEHIDADRIVVGLYGFLVGVLLTIMAFVAGGLL